MLHWLRAGWLWVPGLDSADATSSKTPTEDFAAQLVAVDTFQSRPLAGKRVAIVRELMGAGVDAGVDSAVRRAISHLESLGAIIGEVGVPAKYVWEGLVSLRPFSARLRGLLAPPCAALDALEPGDK